MKISLTNVLFFMSKKLNAASANLPAVRSLLSKVSTTSPSLAFYVWQQHFHFCVSIHGMQVFNGGVNTSVPSSRMKILSITAALRKFLRLEFPIHWDGNSHGRLIDNQSSGRQVIQYHLQFLRSFSTFDDLAGRLYNLKITWEKIGIRKW